MRLHKKLSGFTAAILLCLFLFTASANAQQCDTAINEARGYYANGQYEYVHSVLNTCLSEFNNNRDYYRGDGSGSVFVVYKIICDSFSAAGQEYQEEDKENELIYFFDGVYNPGDVLDILDATTF